MRTTHPTVRSLRSALAHSRSGRRDHRQLERELAEYETPAARDDLVATLARYPDEDSAPIRRILTRQALSRPRGTH